MWFASDRIVSGCELSLSGLTLDRAAVVEKVVAVSTDHSKSDQPPRVSHRGTAAITVRSDSARAWRCAVIVSTVRGLSITLCEWPTRGYAVGNAVFSPSAHCAIFLAGSWQVSDSLALVADAAGHVVVKDRHHLTESASSSAPDSLCMRVYLIRATLQHTLCFAHLTWRNIRHRAREIHIFRIHCVLYCVIVWKCHHTRSLQQRVKCYYGHLTNRRFARAARGEIDTDVCNPEGKWGLIMLLSWRPR